MAIKFEGLPKRLVGLSKDVLIMQWIVYIVKKLLQREREREVEKKREDLEFKHYTLISEPAMLLRQHPSVSLIKTMFQLVMNTVVSDIHF